VLRIVLPCVALARTSPSIDVPVKVIVVVDVYIAVVPIAVAPVVGPRSPQNKSGSEGHPHAGVVTRIGIRIIGIGRRRSSVNHLRVI
jgi:hypothetical protein